MSEKKPKEFDGMTVRSQLLTDIKGLLILQLITSGMGASAIAITLGYTSKQAFLKDFKWVRKYMGGLA